MSILKSKGSKTSEREDESFTKYIRLDFVMNIEKLNKETWRLVESYKTRILLPDLPYLECSFCHLSTPLKDTIHFISFWVYLSYDPFSLFFFKYQIENN